jgi:hypothetical protein
MTNTWISHLNLEKSELWKYEIFTWKFMKAHEKYLNLTSELAKEWTLKVWYFFMKIHESAWKILESHIWTRKRLNFESLRIFHENSWKRMKNTWISHLTREKGEFWKFDIFHENSWKRMNNTWISHLNREKGELWKFEIFTWKFMKAHEKYFNLTSEVWKERTLKVWDFYMKIHESAWKILESHIWTWKRTNFESLIFLHENSWKRMTNTWISHLNLEKNELW